MPTREKTIPHSRIETLKTDYPAAHRPPALLPNCPPRMAHAKTEERIYFIRGYKGINRKCS